jgi:23S rRNA pseudouridine2605 synthase
MTVRLQKHLAACGVAARRKAEKLIAEGRVKVNGVVVTELGTKINPASDLIEVDNNPVRSAPLGVALFHKPRRVVSTLSDPEGRPAIKDYLTKKFESYFPVGRLDFESEGLVILTNDGDLSERLLHPRFEIDRSYRVSVEGRVSQAVAAKLEQGVKLVDGLAKARATHVEDLPDGTVLDLVVREGRNRLIRRMMEEVGHPVTRLTRMSHGPFRLGSLRSGQVEALTEDQYRRLKEEVVRRTGDEAPRRKPAPSRAELELNRRARENKKLSIRKNRKT